MTSTRQTRNLFFGISLRGATVELALTTVLVLTVLTTLSARAQAFQVIYNFTGWTGHNLKAGLTLDRGGNLYGTAVAGGMQACPGYGCGTVFKLSHRSSGWVFDPLYSFEAGNDGDHPQARVIFGPDGRLYGTTSDPSPFGAVFNLRPPPTACKTALCPWTHTVLHLFAGSDGWGPTGDLVFDLAGNLYGTTFEGGSHGQGAVYELTPSNGGWTESVLYSFMGGTDGENTNAGVIFDKFGNLYGTTTYGGMYNCGNQGCGTVYELTPSGSGWTKTILYNFQGRSDGDFPGGLVFDDSGNLYGTTSMAVREGVERSSG